MIKDTLIFAATCDFAGHVRGKAFPETDRASRETAGVGYTGSNIMLSAFGPIYSSPFGTKGDLKLVPDISTLAPIPGQGNGEPQLALGDIRNLDDSPWTCCPRSFLKRGLSALENEFGLRLVSAFEQEFWYDGVEAAEGTSYTFGMYRRSGDFGERLFAALRAAGITPDTFLTEAGDQQFEVTVKPSKGLRSADEAVLLREIVRACAAQVGKRAILSPLLDPDGVGNGTHIHLSLIDSNGSPVLYDPNGPLNLSDIGASFAAGLLLHMPALAAITTPSVASYYRLRPGKWAPTWANLGDRDRGSSLRICPTSATTAEGTARQFNLEYRVVDAASSPYMALGAIVHAGLDGLRQRLILPNHPQEPNADMEAAGVASLPHSLGEALDMLEGSLDVRSWMGDEMMGAYVMLKHSEISAVAELSEQAVCARYAEVY
jgi:glutamine synthetase